MKLIVKSNEYQPTRRTHGRVIPILIFPLEKGKQLPVGHVSRRKDGDYRKVSKDKWVQVKKRGSSDGKDKQKKERKEKIDLIAEFMVSMHHNPDKAKKSKVSSWIDSEMTDEEIQTTSEYLRKNGHVNIRSATWDRMNGQMLKWAITFDLSVKDAREAERFMNEVLERLAALTNHDVLDWALKHHADDFKSSILDRNPMGRDIADAVWNDLPLDDILREKESRKKQPYQSWELKRREQALQSWDVTEMTPFEAGVNSTERVTLTDSKTGDQIQACWKAKSGEKAGIRSVMGGTYYIREAAAYEIDKALGLGMVPPTVIAESESGEVGSMQEWVPDAELATYLTKYNREKAISEDASIKAALMDFLLMNTDRHSGNYMIDTESGQVHRIDNGLALPWTGRFEDNIRSDFASHPDIMSSDLPEDMQNALQTVDIDNLCETLLEMGAGPGAVDQFYQRFMWLRDNPKIPSSEEQHKEPWGQGPLYTPGTKWDQPKPKQRELKRPDIKPLP